MTMLAKKQADHVVYGDLYRLKKWSNLQTMEEVEDALRILASPDTKRPGQEFDGRRIESVGKDEWLVLNGAKYEVEMQKINERARKAQWARKNRELERQAKAKKIAGGSGGGGVEKGLADLDAECESGLIPGGQGPTAPVKKKERDEYQQDQDTRAGARF